LWRDARFPCPFPRVREGERQGKTGNAMHRVAISGTGLFTPEDVVTNAELVASYNAYAEAQNAKNAGAIAAGAAQALPFSSEEFIVKASGIERRYVMDKKGVLDPAVMHPILRERADDELSIMAEIAVAAAREAMNAAGRTAGGIDAGICARPHHERAYPAPATEAQQP